MLVVSGQVEYASVIAAMHSSCFNDKWSEKSIQTLLSLPTTIGWVSEYGFLLCSHVLDEMEILTIGVLPECRRKSIGTNLLEEMIKWASNANITKIFLEVSVRNIPAQKLYQKFGFCKTGVRTGYYQTPQGPVDALCLTKFLAE